MDALFVHKLDRLEKAVSSFAVLSLTSNGSPEADRASRLYKARRDDFLIYAEKKGI